MLLTLPYLVIREKQMAGILVVFLLKNVGVWFFMLVVLDWCYGPVSVSINQSWIYIAHKRKASNARCICLPDIQNLSALEVLYRACK